MFSLETASRHRSSYALAATTVASLILGIGSGITVVGGLQAAGTIVSQKNRTFLPDTLSLTKGEVVTIVNDDSDLLHHAYVDSPTFSFDSGDQEPGSRTPITFSEKGVFQVLCGIHPKMKLVVRVN